MADDLEVQNLRFLLREARAAVRVQDEYIRQQTAKLRELEAYCRTQATDGHDSTYHAGLREAYADVAGRVTAILGLVVRDEEPT